MTCCMSIRNENSVGLQQKCNQQSAFIITLGVRNAAAIQSLFFFNLCTSFVHTPCKNFVRSLPLNLTGR